MPAVAAAADEPVKAVARAYRKFARREARGRSAAYESLAESVAGDAAVAGFVASLPPDKRRPTLLFAAARYLLGAPPGIRQLRELASRSRAELTEVILTRRVQTNEPARCAVLLPALAQLPRRWRCSKPAPAPGSPCCSTGTPTTTPDTGSPAATRTPPPCAASPAGPYRSRRGSPRSPGGPGLTSTPWMSPKTMTSAGYRAWSGPGRATAGSGSRPRSPQPAATRPPCYRGDLLTGLPALAAQAPPGATLVIYHCSVLYQVSPHQRQQFAAAVRRLRARWLSSEDPGIVPGTAARALDDQMCVLARDGHAIATADSHGTWLQWLP